MEKRLDDILHDRESNHLLPFLWMHEGHHNDLDMYSSNAIMLIDEKNGLLFTGDTYYPALLYAFSADSVFSAYAASMRKVADKNEIK